MTAPEPLSRFERLQNVIRTLHNNRVNQLFRDIKPEDPVSGRKILKQDLIITDNDTFQTQTICIQILNDYIDNERNVYAIPVEEFNREVAIQPQLVLRFIEKQSTANSFNRRRVEMRFGIRLVDKTRITITEAYITELEREIKAQFPKTYGYDKGKICFSYRAKSQGIESKLYGKNEADAKELITKALAVVDKTPEWDYLTKSEYTDKNLTTPKYETILGKRTKLPIQRPTATVYLKRAELKIGGLLEDRILLDRYV